MSKLWLVIIVFTLIGGCKEPIKDAIAAKFEEKCKGDTICQIDLKEVTNFKWDKFYIVKAGVNPDKALGFRYPYWEDVANRIIFVAGNVVTYHEDEFPDPETKPKGGVIFNIYNHDASYSSFSSNNAVFTVKKATVDDLVYYELTPVRGDLSSSPR